VLLFDDEHRQYYSPHACIPLNNASPYAHHTLISVFARRIKTGLARFPLLFIAVDTLSLSTLSRYPICVIIIHSILSL
jgi:hypothetical protein